MLYSPRLENRSAGPRSFLARRCLMLVTAFGLAAGIATARGDDWPQWMGPGRDNVWREDGLLEKFPPGGPQVVWSVPVAGGYSGPAVAGDLVVVTDYVTKDDVKVDNFDRQAFTGVERVQALDAATGRLRWKHEYPVTYTISYPAGPRCTPIIHQRKVYTLGAEGHLFCLEASTGSVLWSKNFGPEYQTKTALWGYAGHPLIAGQKLICIVGGEGSHAVAFDKDTGEELWRALSATEQGYSPPTMIEAGGVRQLILPRPGAVSSVDPETGKEYWSVPYEATNGSIIMSPLKWKNYLYVGGYSDKNLMLDLASDRPEVQVLWQDQRRLGLAPVNVQPIIDDGVMYGYDQRGTFHGVDLPSGERLWSTTEPIGGRAQGTETSFLVKQADRYWIFTEKGDLVIGRLSRDGFEELDRAHVLDPTNVAFGRKVVWCAPAFARRCMFVRNDERCVCISLAKDSAP